MLAQIDEALNEKGNILDVAEGGIFGRSIARPIW
jgi:hypothetical protein